MDTMSVNTKLLIWSKDRACQLHLLLEGIHKHLPGIFDISVLYTTSNPAFESGYDRVKREFPSPTVDWIKESNFHDDTLDIIKSSKLDNLCVSTDDTIVYRTPPTKPLDYICAGEVFSFRLGLNTILQNPHDGMVQPPLHNYTLNRDILNWNALLYAPYMNYGYPFGLDMHCFGRQYFYSLITGFDFNSTSELEGNLYRYRHDCPHMFAFEHSIAFNVPLNKLSQTIYQGESTRFTMSDLNDKYLKGLKINLEPIENTEIIGCHQFIDLEFVNG